MSMDKLSLVAGALALKPAEREVVEYLLQYGGSKAAEMRSFLHLDKTQYYRALESLQDSGIITVFGERRSQVVELVEMAVLQEALAKKKREIEMAQNSLATLADQAKQMVNSSYFSRNIEVISGKDAYLRSMKSVLAGGGPVLRDITPDSAVLYKMAGGKKEYEGIVSQIKRLRKSKKIAIQILFDNSAKIIDGLSKTNRDDMKEARMFQGDLHLNCYLNICGSKTLFYSQNKVGCWGLVIKDEIISKMLAALFDAMWGMSDLI